MSILPSEYHPSQATTYGGTHHDRLQNTPSYDEPEHYCLTIQPFRAGGFESTLRLVDLQAAADRDIIPRKTGLRVKPDSPSPDSLLASRRRSKSMVRKRAKDMGANRLVTLTIRQTDELGYFSPDDWCDLFAEFHRALLPFGFMRNYVAVLEPHKKGLERLLARTGAPTVAHDASWDVPLHIHIATRSDQKMPINLMRKLWGVVLARRGRDGNIDVQFLRTEHGSDASIDKVASYVSKYISKGFADFDRFNKKRYWSAGHSLLPSGRTWLQAREMVAALHEARHRMGLDDAAFASLVASNGVFLFPSGCGAWFNVRPPIYANAPPPF